MMFDFGGDAAEKAGAPPTGQPEAGDGERTPAQARPPCQPPPSPGDPVRGAIEAPEDEFGRPGTQPTPDAVTALLPVLKDISGQFGAYTEAMETAVRDLAETENDLQAELQHMVRHAKQVLAAHGQMRHRFTDRLSRVSRCLRSQLEPARRGREPQ